MAGQQQEPKNTTEESRRDSVAIAGALERTRLIEQIEATRDELAQARDAGAISQRLQIELASLRFELAVLRRNHAEELAGRAAAEHEARRIEVERADLATQLRQMTQARDALLTSAAWKLTWPLRRLSEALPPTMLRHTRRVARAAWWARTPWRLPSRLAHRTWRASGVAVPAPALEPPASPAPPEVPYPRWIATVEPELGPVLAQAGQLPAFTEARVGFLLPGAGTPLSLAATLDSLRALRDPDWECLLPMPAGANGSLLLIELAADPRFTLLDLSFSERGAVLSALLERAAAPWVAILDAGDRLEPDTLGRFAVALAVSPDAAIAYADEDELVGTLRRNPWLKPSWSPQLLQTFNYLGRPTLLWRGLARAAGGFKPDDGDGSEWGLALRIADLAAKSGRPVLRVPRVLCHRAPGGPRERPLPGTLGADERAAVLARYWQAQGHDAQVETQPDGTLRSRWTAAQFPLVSVIIVAREGDPAPLRGVVSMLQDRRNRRIELIVTRDSATVPGAILSGPRVQNMDEECAPGVAAACNRGAAAAKGTLLLFIVSNLEVADGDWIGELARVAGLPGVGVVGPRPHDRDLRVAVGSESGAPGSEADADLFVPPAVQRNRLAVTGAWLMSRRTVYDRVGGFVENFDVAESQIVFCLRAWRAGWHVVETPWAEMRQGRVVGNISFAANDSPGIARERARIGIDEDPFLHPGLNAERARPTLRAAGELDSRALFRPTPDVAAPAILDPHDDAAAMAATGLERTLLLWPPQSPGAVGCAWAAARWLIDLLRSRPDLRRRFPCALTDGTEGPFAEWLLGEGAVQLGLPDTALEHLYRALGGTLASRPREAYLARGDLRQAFPLGLLPPGCGALFSWLLRHGCDEAGLRREECWWWLLSTSEDPSAELVRTYRVSPAWQRAHPAGLTRFASNDLAEWIARRYDVAPDTAWLNPAKWPTELSPVAELRLGFFARDEWRLAHPDALHTLQGAEALLGTLAAPQGGLAPAERRWCAERITDGTAARLVGPGVNVIGHFCYPSGLRVSAEALCDAMASAGIAISRRDMRTDPNDDPHHSDIAGLELHDVTIIHIQPEPFFPTCYERAELAPRVARTRRIAYWYWELETVPDSWAETARSVDEIWTATRFVAEALRRTVRVPVRTVFPGVQVGPFTPMPRSDFAIPGWDDGRFTFLFSFHMGSIMERKNPLGLIEAFRNAFAPYEPVDLILKTTSSPGHTDDLLRLRRAAEGANIRLVDRVLTGEQNLALMHAVDAYVSLHRSEGLGLTMAEAMLIGKPVIATRYSGNLDFMDNANSLLVDCELVPVGRVRSPYDADERWAQPSLAHASVLMRRLYNDPAAAHRLGLAGQTDARRRLSLEAAGINAAAHLRAMDTAQLGPDQE